MADELTDFETKLLKWLVKRDLPIQPWVRKEAVKAFQGKGDEIYGTGGALYQEGGERRCTFQEAGGPHPNLLQRR